MTYIKYATVSNNPYVPPVHPDILILTKNSTCVAFYDLKHIYDGDIQFFHEVCVVKQALLKQVFTAVKEQ